MNMLRILTFPEPFLSRTARTVENIDGKLQEAIEAMGRTMYMAPGVGLAAVQVGIDKQMLVYDITAPDGERALHVLINPRIVESEGSYLSENEGCLSVPEFRANVNRARRVLVDGVDRDGNPVRLEAEDFLATVLQHEIDHLNGKLFIDRISPLKRQLYKRRVQKQLKQK